jgi:integrase
VEQFAPRPPAPHGEARESCDEWHKRYLKFFAERGVSTTGDKGYRWSKWIAPLIGGKEPKAVTREDVEQVRNDLDAAIRDGRIRWKTAANVWGELSASLGEMLSSKRKDRQVITADPSNGVQAPETGGSTSKVYPYPSEFLAVASYPDDVVPLAWREIHTIAAYTYLRPGELWVLEWADIDLDDQRIHVTKAWDFTNRKTKATKTDETRTIPIEPTLLPLLERMHKRAAGKGLVVRRSRKRSRTR